MNGRRVFIDESGDAAAPEGVLEARTEVEFLQAAFGDRSLVVRGPRLAPWARRYFTARDEPVEELRGRASLLAGALGVDANLASQLLDRFPERCAGRSGRQDLLVALLGAAPALSGSPGGWLAAMLQLPEDEALRSLAAVASAQAQQELAADGMTGSLNDLAAGARTPETALTAVWTCYAEPPGAWWNPVEAPLPEGVAGALRGELARRAVQDPLLLMTLVGRSAHPALPGMAATEAARVLTTRGSPVAYREGLAILELCDDVRRPGLRRLLKAPPPPAAPADLGALDSWFENEYLPFREFPGPAPVDADALLLDYGRRYLDWYRLALNGGPGRERLSWVKAGALADPTVVTLFIVLDGLGFPDARLLAREVESRGQGLLTLVDLDLALAPLPTITSVAKPALVRAVPPNEAHEAADRGPTFRVEVRDDPNLDGLSDALRKAHAGDIITWSVLEPDSLYHAARSLYDAEQTVRGFLKTFALRLVQVVAGLPDPGAVRVVLGTDHGRLLTAAEREVTAPDGFQSHGRAALGAVNDREFPAEGVIWLDAVAVLHPGQFRLPQAAAVIADGGCFRDANGRSGHEIHPHGGLSPEETLIPWLVFAPHVELHAPSVSLRGADTEGWKGSLLLTVENTAQAPLTIDAVTLNLPGIDNLTASQRIAPQGHYSRDISIAVWPTETQARAARPVLHYHFADGKARQTAIENHIEVESFGDSGPGNLLGGL